jgi:hypothetical protein
MGLSVHSTSAAAFTKEGSKGFGQAGDWKNLEQATGVTPDFSRTWSAACKVAEGGPEDEGRLAPSAMTIIRFCLASHHENTGHEQNRPVTRHPAFILAVATFQGLSPV